MLETIKISEEEATIRRLMDSVFMKAAEAERLRCENENLSATIDKVRIAMRKRGFVVAIQAVNQTIYEHDHIDEGVIECQ